MSTKMQQNQIIEWRRTKVMELLSKGESNQSEIARVLQVDRSIICRDIAHIRELPLLTKKEISIMISIPSHFLTIITSALPSTVCPSLFTAAL